MIECENNEEFIIANLSSSVFNETLDLAFNEGEKICFKVDGPGTVHLTGNLLDEDNMPPTGEGFDMLGGSDSEMGSEEEAGDRIKEVVEKPAGKRKKVEEVKSQEVVAKKAKIDPAAVEESEDSDDDDDESGEEGTTDADTTANATTGDDEEDDSEDSDDEDDSEDGEDSKEEVKAKEVKPNQAKKEAKKMEKEASEEEEDDSEDGEDSKKEVKA